LPGAGWCGARRDVMQASLYDASADKAGENSSGTVSEFGHPVSRATVVRETHLHGQAITERPMALEKIS